MPRLLGRQQIVVTGHKIRARRQWLQMTLSEVAHAIGVEHQQLQKYETGRNQPGLGAIMKLATVLKTTPHKLLGWDMPDGGDPDVAAFFADPSVMAIIRRLRSMDGPKRQLAHSLICTVDKQ